MKKFIFPLLMLVTFAVSIANAQQVDNQSLPSDEKGISVAHDVKIYPNPVTENVIRINSADLIKKVELINVIGQTLQKVENTYGTEQVRIELKDKEKGMYLVKVTFLQDQKTVIKRILVK